MTETTLPRPTFARTVRGSGPGLVLAHGAGGAIAANYGPILDTLAATRTVVGVDLPGSGETPPATRRSTPTRSPTSSSRRPTPRASTRSRSAAGRSAARSRSARRRGTRSASARSC